MTKDCQDAMLILHERYARLSKKGAKIRELEAVDLALDELTNNPLRIGNPAALAAFALKSAYKKLGWREKHHERNVVEDVADSLAHDAVYCCTDEPLYQMIELKDFIDRSSLNAKDKELLGYLHDGMDVDEIATVKGKSRSVAAVWVSRARKHFRMAWKEIV